MSESNVPANNGGEVVEQVSQQLENEASPAETSAVNAVDSTDNLNAKEAVKQAEKSFKKKLKIKVDGEESEEEVDWDDEESLKRHIQFSKVAQKRMAETSKLQREVQEFLELLKTDPKRILSDPSIGIDLKQFAAGIIEEEIANSKKTPEQLKAEQLENELRTLKEEREREHEERKTKELSRLEKAEAERYDMLITKALDKGDLPKSPYVVKKIADYLYLGLQEGLDISPDDVIPLVKEEMENDVKQMFAVMPDEIIEQLVGTDVINRIRKKKVEAAKKAAPSVTAPKKDSMESPAGKQVAAGTKKTIKEFFGV
jgi:hypothetical protein